MYEDYINLCEPYKLYEHNQLSIAQFIYEVIQELKPHYKKFPYIKSFAQQLNELRSSSASEYNKSEELESILEDFYSYCADKNIEVISNYYDDEQRESGDYYV